MRKLDYGELSQLKAGDMSYGAGGVCGVALAGALYGWSAGPPGFIAMSVVGGAACAFSMWAARNEQ